MRRNPNPWLELMLLTMDNQETQYMDPPIHPIKVGVDPTEYQNLFEQGIMQNENKQCKTRICTPSQNVLARVEFLSQSRADRHCNCCCCCDNHCRRCCDVEKNNK